MRRVAIAIVLLSLASGCGGGDEAAPDSTQEDVPELPECAGPATFPPDLPVDFPLPPGTEVITSESPYPKQLVVFGVIPANLQEAAAFFNTTLPLHGYEVGIGDAEGTESEAPFTGNGYRGRWRVNEIAECSALRLTLVLIEQT